MPQRIDYKEIAYSYSKDIDRLKSINKELVQAIKDTIQIMKGSNFNSGYLKQALLKAGEHAQ